MLVATHPFCGELHVHVPDEVGLGRERDLRFRGVYRTRVAELFHERLHPGGSPALALIASLSGRRERSSLRHGQPHRLWRDKQLQYLAARA
jgi:hypothetical protein